MSTYAWMRQEPSSSRKYWTLFPDCKVILGVREDDLCIIRKCCSSIELTEHIECFTIQDCIHVIANSEGNALHTSLYDCLQYLVY